MCITLENVYLWLWVVDVISVCVLMCLSSVHTLFFGVCAVHPLYLYRVCVRLFYGFCMCVLGPPSLYYSVSVCTVCLCVLCLWLYGDICI